WPAGPCRRGQRTSRPPPAVTAGSAQVAARSPYVAARSAQAAAPGAGQDPDGPDEPEADQHHRSEDLGTHDRLAGQALHEEQPGEGQEEQPGDGPRRVEPAPPPLAATAGAGHARL